MKKILTLGLLLFQLIGFSQIITITDSENGQPLEQVSLFSASPRAFTTTNINGEADITPFNGAQKIEIRLIGYKALELSYTDLKNKGFGLSLLPDNFALEQAVVSATRWSQKKREVPSKITSITAKEIALQNPQTAADLLATSGEVFIQKSQLGGGSPIIRGFSTNRLLLTVDGVRMNTAIFRSGNVQNVISIDPFAIQSTEVLFGPGSVIYGSDAIGGVMSFQTLTPRFSLNDKPKISGNAVSRYSSASSERTGHFDINIGWKKWASVSSVTFTDFDDLQMGSNGPHEYLRHFYVQRQDSMDVVVANDDPLVQRPTAYSQTSFMQKLRYQPVNNWDLTYSLHYSATTAYSRYDRLIQLSNSAPKYAQWNYGPQKWLMNNINITNYSENIIYDRISFRLAHQYFEESRINRRFQNPDRTSRVEKVNAYSANIDLEKILNDNNKLYYGLEWVRNDVDSKGIEENISTGLISATSSRYPQANWESYAAYLTYQWDVSKNFIVQAGTRYSRFVLNADFTDNLDFYPLPFTEANINNGALTGSLGFAWNPSEHWNISSNISTGFRAPNVDDIGKIFDSEPGSVVVPNPGLDAEYAYNAEASITRIFSKGLKIDITGFYTLLKDALVRRDFALDGRDSILYEGLLSQVQAIQNAAVTTVYGIQAGVSLKLPAGFGISSRLNFQKGEEELDDGTTGPSRHAAPLFGVSHFTYTNGRLKIDLYTMYSAEVSAEDLSFEERAKEHIYATDENGKPYSPAWYTLNFKAQYPLSRTFSVSAGLENITDQRYRPYSSGLVASGRNFILSLKASF